MHYIQEESIMKKALALILTASLLTGVLTACGSSEAQTDAAETTTEEAAAEETGDR